MIWALNGLRWLACLVLGLAGFAQVVRPERAPILVLPGLLLSFAPLVRGWVGSRGTELRASLIWVGLGLTLGIASEAAAWVAPLEGGRPGAGTWAYLAVLAMLAASISVLNARTPGGGAWAILMALLVVVFLFPWLEGAGLRSGNALGRLRLDNPWTLFYGLLVLAGVTNYLPTRFGPAAAVVGVAFLLEYLALTGRVPSLSGRARVWSVVPWLGAVAVFVADARSRSRPRAGGLDGLWIWFRDHWGVVWALRVQERFNRSAELQKWPFRLGWYGLTGPSDPAALAVAEATLLSLLRRFAKPERLAEVLAEREGGRSCEPSALQ